jgi:exonuclease VII small subunit
MYFSKNKFLIINIVTLLLGQSVCAKVTIKETKTSIAKTEKLLDSIKEFHQPNIELLKPFNKTRTPEADKTIEKKMHHAALKMNREPGFWSGFFFGESAHNDMIHPFMWYYKQVHRAIKLVKLRIKRSTRGIKSLEKQTTHKKLLIKEKEVFETQIKELETLVTRLNNALADLEVLLAFIKQTESYIKESAEERKTLKEDQHRRQLVNSINSLKK